MSMEEITETCAKSVGIAIKQTRGKRHLSQEALAGVCELDRSYIGQVERGEKNISLESILRITRGLKIKPSQLFEAAGY